MSVDPEAAALIYAAWQEPDGPRRGRVLAGLTAPGPVALRCRYRQLLDPQAPAGPWDPGWPLESWMDVISLEDEGDQAITRNDTARAEEVFALLAGLDPSATHRVVTVNARVGMGDIGLATGDYERAAGDYDAALGIAVTDGYRFGMLRALLGLGYLTLMAHSAGMARNRFAEAADIAAAVGDPVYASNATLGIGECDERLGDIDGAITKYAEAYKGFAAIRAALGQGNAAQRLGTLLHRSRRQEASREWVAEARDWLERARAAFTEARNPMGMTNVLSGLGDLLLDTDDFDGAERYYAEGLSIAEANDLRLSRAHALQDVARVAQARHDPAAAAAGFRASLAAYQEVNDLLGMTNAFDKLAEAHVGLGEPAEALRVRMEAIFAVEEYRATHRDEASQREYRDRFRRVYSAALDAAAEHGSAAAFAVSADCLAGRRLAGLFAATANSAMDPVGTGELALIQEILVRADQRLVDHRHRARASVEPVPAPGGDRRERVVRLLGAVGVKYGLVPQAEASLDDLLAALYLSPADEGAELLAALPDDCHVLQALIDPEDAATVRWLWRAADGAVLCGSMRLSPDAARLILTLANDADARAGLRMPDMAPLTSLLPDALREAITARAGQRLLLIPVGDLWLVPWGAIPVSGDTVLAEHATLVVCPSLTVQRLLAQRGVPPRPAIPWPADVWRSPLINEHLLPGLRDDPAWRLTLLRTAAEARQRLRSGGDAMVVAGHGRPVPGLGHYLELDRGEWLLPVDLVGARPPRLLVVIACWGGAVPGSGPSDPLSLATLALAAGSAEIMATVGELADSPFAAACVERMLATLPTAGSPGTGLPEALNSAVRWALADEGMRALPISHWAPLTAFGTFY